MNFLTRVNKILEYKNISRTKLAKKLDIKQATLNRYFDNQQQEKLLPLFYKMVEVFPEISREWLFFGEGEMLQSDKNRSIYEKELEEKLSLLEAELKEENALNKKLTKELLQHLTKNEEELENKTA